MVTIKVFTITKVDVYLKDNYLLSSCFVKWTVISAMALDFTTWGFRVEIQKAQHNRKTGEKKSDRADP